MTKKNFTIWFVVHCTECGNICEQQVPLLKLAGDADYRCPNCGFILVKFSSEELE